MGLARELTLGTSGGRRRRGPGRFALPSEFTALRALTGRVCAGNATADETAELAELIRTVSARPQRMRFEEGAILNAACAAYQEATGNTIGPATGVLA